MYCACFVGIKKYGKKVNKTVPKAQATAKIYNDDILLPIICFCLSGHQCWYTTAVQKFGITHNRMFLMKALTTINQISCTMNRNCCRVVFFCHCDLKRQNNQ